MTVGYPSAQASYMKGEINITLRGENDKEVIDRLMTAITHLDRHVGAKGLQATVAAPDVKTKTCSCGSSMKFKTVNLKDGTIGSLWECTNPIHKDKSGKYQHSEWIK